MDESEFKNGGGGGSSGGPAAAVALAVAAVEDRDGIQWWQRWGLLMAAAAFDGVQRQWHWTMAAAKEEDKVARRCRHNNQLEVTTVASHWHG